MNWTDLAHIHRNRATGLSNGGWAYDAYPELETLDAGKTISVARIDGPAVITCIHLTQHLIYKSEDERYTNEERTLATRGIILEICFDDAETPAVRVPLSDFFADGCCGRAGYYSTLFVEKAPESYNCFIPMPFRRSAQVMLRNETDRNLSNYTFVEYERLDRWPEDTGYFHATWKRFAFQLDADTDKHFFHIDGCGHLIGRAWSICTAEPFFKDYSFIMEGNNEIRIDGEAQPRIDYLGTEDSFGFSWGFGNLFNGLYNGINYLDKRMPLMLSIYRFMGSNAIRFNRSLDLRIDWSNEFRFSKKYEEFKARIGDVNKAGGGYVDYATTYYWYQDSPGFAHDPLPPLGERLIPVLPSGDMKS